MSRPGGARRLDAQAEYAVMLRLKTVVYVVASVCIGISTCVLGSAWWMLSG